MKRNRMKWNGINIPIAGSRTQLKSHHAQVTFEFDQATLMSLTGAESGDPPPRSEPRINIYIAQAATNPL